MSVSDQKKKQIIEAAIAEFQERGFAGASMDRISDRAQVSKRTVYNHFESKEVLFKGINQCLADQINSALEMPYDPDLPIREALIRLGWAEGELMINPCFMSLARIIMSETIRDPELAADMNSRMTKLSVFAEHIQEAIKEGKLSADDPSVAAEQFLGLLKSRAFYPNIYASRVPERPEMEKIIEESVDMFLARYAAKAV
ncbi:putative acrEF/envCD operon repressor [Labrenzia sp. THAF82]|uniref:TetR/AcrR family transcriptional regulator n=1 Tax=Labrenzia sp. THAF82 TaxID=2587861 RepID=UPI00126856F6|nr:TetR/AcrR family transcriptional regulator [Labrenzia sp. THAF82]QFT29745.1 putative acrEF/envCD operon repressor [Labrenzia sp. THAF82]